MSNREVEICSICGAPVHNQEDVYRIQAGNTLQITKGGGHTIFECQSMDYYAHVSCTHKAVVERLRHKWQKQPDKCSLCGEMFDNGINVISRITRGSIYENKETEEIEFDEDTERPSMIPDYYLCVDCSLSIDGVGSFASELEIVIEAVDYNSGF
jgi:hypothetical protein